MGGLGHLLLNLLIPPRCGGCRVITSRDGVLCPTCWQGLDRIGHDVCDCCGVPFATPMPSGTLCGRCLAEKPAFDHARAVFAYAGTGRDLVLGLKHNDRQHLARMIGGWMAPIVQKMTASDTTPPVLVPVPLHWSRLWHRQYNQSWLLAKSIQAQLKQADIMDDLVIRHRRTPPQGSPGAPKRSENIRNAFRLHRPERIKGQSIMLVDDVLTSGSTAHEIARLLKKHHPTRVQIVTAARVGLD